MQGHAQSAEVDGEWALRAETADFISGALLKTEIGSGHVMIMNYDRYCESKQFL